jgi:hypothetical protein
MDNDPRFADFVILQAQNAGLFLGQIPNPATGEREVKMVAARSVLDSLEMLENKTAGNRTAEEDKLLQLALLNLRTLYAKVEAEQEGVDEDPDGPDVDDESDDY